MSAEAVELSSCAVSNHQETLTGAIGTAFMLLVNAIFVEKSTLGSTKDYPEDYGPRLAQGPVVSFDIIIVGAGVGGCVLANRLSEITNWNILLLEAGNYPTASSDVPALFNDVTGTSEDWNFETEPEKNFCQGLVNKKCRISRGRALGGTSTINNLHYRRAIPDDFASWPKSEKYKWNADQVNEHFDNVERSDGGFMTLDDLNEPGELKDCIYAAASAMSYAKITSSDAHLGYADVRGTIKDGARENYAKAFLRSARRRSNLYFARNAYVAKIETQLPIDKRIKGIKVYIGDKEVTVRAKKEIILTGGAINTAKLLLLSGFGPKEFLERLSIPTVIDLNVGKKFQAQVSTMLFVGVDKNAPIRDAKRATVHATYSYLMNRKGEFRQTNINDVVGLINTKDEAADYPNVIVYHYFFPARDATLEVYLKKIGFVKAIVKSIVAQNQNESLVLFMPTLVKPKSRGQVLIKSTNPFEQAMVKGNFLSDLDNDDFQSLLSGVKFVLKMIETRPFAEHGAHFLNVDMPNCRNLKYCNEPYLACVVRNMGVPTSHIVGTAAMGDIGCDPCRVTSEEMLVDGVRHLRIVDGSVIPEGITGNLETTVAMMADKVAQEIKNTWLKK